MWELGDKAAAEGTYLFTYPTTGYFDAFFYALMYACLLYTSPGSRCAGSHTTGNPSTGRKKTWLVVVTIKLCYTCLLYTSRCV